MAKYSYTRFEHISILAFFTKKNQNSTANKGTITASKVINEMEGIENMKS